MFLKNYTGQEIENITDEQVKKIIEFECADAGCPMLPNMPVMPVKPEYKPDMQLYQVGGYYGWCVASLEDATKLLDVLANIEVWEADYVGSNYNNKIGKRKDTNSELKAENVKVFSPKLWSEVKSEIESYNQLKKNYDLSLENYNQAVKDRESISTWVWEVVSGARSFKCKREQLEQFKVNYLELAEGNEELGNKFFLKAYPDAEKWINNYYTHEDLKQIITSD